MKESLTSYALFVAYLLTVPAANWLISNIGVQFDPDGPHLIPIFPGIMAPSGVLMVGVALALRDVVQNRLGLKWAAGAVIGGSLLSWLVASPFLAIASAAAFVVSESLDLAVYTPLKARGWTPAAILASGLVGSVVDSVAFLLIAFGSIDHIEGQILGKAMITLLAAAIAYGYTMRTAPAPVIDVPESVKTWLK